MSALRRLLLGTALSMLTAVLATRAILSVLGGFDWFDNPRFMGATGDAPAADAPPPAAS